MSFWYETADVLVVGAFKFNINALERVRAHLSILYNLTKLQVAIVPAQKQLRYLGASHRVIHVRQQTQVVNFRIRIYEHDCSCELVAIRVSGQLGRGFSVGGRRIVVDCIDFLA
jgi:hypothetical protein